MDSIGFLPLVWWSLGATGLVGLGIYLYLEYQAYLLRTQVSGIPGGLRFTSRPFMVEARYGAKQLMVEAHNAHFTRQPVPEGDETVQSGAVTATLPAAGLQMRVFRMVEKNPGSDAPKETGFCRVVFTGSDELRMQATGSRVGERSVVRLDGVPASIAQDFQTFANTLQAWLNKVEHGLKMEIEAARLREVEAAGAAAAAAAAAAEREALGAQGEGAVLDDEQRDARAATQIAAWRASAGFKGSASEVSLAPNGEVAWFVDLDPMMGRIILHANKRTFSGSLKGAQVDTLGGELEVSVRDDYWTEDDPRLVTFRIMGGATSDVRRAWKERLEIVVQSQG